MPRATWCGGRGLPYTRQYFGRPAYLYFLQNLVLFGAGVPLGLAMIGGTLAVCWRNLVRPRGSELVILAFVLPYFAITGDFWAKFMRYLLPIAPFLALFAAASLIWLFDRVRAAASTEESNEDEASESVAESLGDWEAIGGEVRLDGGSVATAPPDARRPIPSAGPTPRSPWLGRLVASSIAVVVAFSAFYSLAFDHM